MHTGVRPVDMTRNAVLAYTARPTSHALPLSHRIAVLGTSLRTAWTLRMQYRRTVAELRGLSARELADLGIPRCAIRGIAREHVYGA